MNMGSNEDASIVRVNPCRERVRSLTAISGGRF